MYKSDFEIKKELCEIGRRIYNDGFVAANDGNFSVKIDDNNYYVTPTGVSKGFMTPEMICKVDGQGYPLRRKNQSTDAFRYSGQQPLCGLKKSACHCL